MSAADDRSRLLVVAANGVGDFLIYLPVLAVARRVPAHKTLIIRRDIHALAAGWCDAFDTIHHVDIRDPDGSLPDFSRYAFEGDGAYDRVVDVFSETVLVETVGRAVGMEVERFAPYGFDESRWHISDIARRHRAALAERLAVDLPADEVVALPPPRLGGRLEAELERHGIDRWAVVCPHGQSAEHAWTRWDKDVPVDVVEQVARGLAERLPVLILGTNRKYLDVGRGVEGVVNLIGEADLVEAAALIRGADLFVGADGGLLHVATHFDRPTVAVFGPTDPGWFGPIHEASRVISTHGGSGSMADIDGDEVLAAALDLLPTRP